MRMRSRLSRFCVAYSFQNYSGIIMTSKYKFLQNVDSRNRAVSPPNIEVVDEWFEPPLPISPDDRTRAWLTPLSVITVLVALLIGYFQGGAAAAEHVWSVGGPVLVGVVSYYYRHERNKNAKSHRESS